MIFRLLARTSNGLYVLKIQLHESPRSAVSYLTDFAGTANCTLAAGVNSTGFGSDRLSRKSAILGITQPVDHHPHSPRVIVSAGRKTFSSQALPSPINHPSNS